MPSHSATYTTEFKSEFEVHRLELLHRRFLWYCGVVIGLSLLGTVAAILGMWFGASVSRKSFGEMAFSTSSIVTWVTSFISLMFYVVAMWWVWPRRLSKDQLLRIVFWLIVGSGVIALGQTPLLAAVMRKDAGGEARSPFLHVQAPSDRSPDTARSDSDNHVPSPPPESSGGDEASDTAPAVDSAREDRAPKKLSPEESTVLVTAGGMWSIFVSHFFACLFLPWTPRESFRPLVPLLALNAVILLFYVRGAPVLIPVLIVLSPLLAAPGAGICMWRHSRFRDSFTLNTLKGRYSEIRRELVDARKIHESLFPAPIRTGPLRMDYRYEPMRQIGGDYLYVRQITPPGGSLVTHVVLVDVTGHGISAALTVNRLHGEIDRQLGERPDASPGDLLNGLNNYLHHSLASHSVYATALCIRVDCAADRITWASAGHPPAFLRGSDGTLDQLDSTTLVLGACRGDDFVANQQSMTFRRGDSIVLYTDGAIECRNSAGRMLGVTGFRGLVSALGLRPGEACLDTLIRAVDTHRFGPLQDDTLLVEISRPV